MVDNKQLTRTHAFLLLLVDLKEKKENVFFTTIFWLEKCLLCRVKEVLDIPGKTKCSFRCSFRCFIVICSVFGYIRSPLEVFSYLFRFRRLVFKPPKLVKNVTITLLRFRFRFNPDPNEDNEANDFNDSNDSNDCNGSNDSNDATLTRVDAEDAEGRKNSRSKAPRVCNVSVSMSKCSNVYSIYSIYSTSTGNCIAPKAAKNANASNCSFDPSVHTALSASSAISATSALSVSLDIARVSNVADSITATKAHKAPKEAKEAKDANVSEAERKKLDFNSSLSLKTTSNTIPFKPSGWLLRCGDVHANPGPGPDPGPGPAPVLQHRQDPSQVDPQHPNRYPSESGKKVKAELLVVSHNVRGLGDAKKVRHLINKCYKLSKQSANSVFLLQETYVPRLDLLSYLWRGEFQLTSGTGNSLGCITLVTAPYKIVRCVEIGQRGHILALTKNNINDVEIIIANVYAPNGYGAEKEQFFEELIEKILEMKATYNCDKTVLAGDLNLVFNNDEVKNRAICTAEQRTAASVKLMLQRANLVDGWELCEKKNFTWTSSRTGQQAFSTLDRVLFTKEKLDLDSKTADWALSVSDHAAVIASFKSSNCSNQKSSLLSRLDPRLLTDEEGIERMNGAFRELFDQRSPDWNPHVSLEYCKMCIRTAANQAAGQVKAKYRDDEAVLNNDINLVVDELANQDIDVNRRALLMHKLDDLRQLKRRFVEKIGAKLERRTARQWYNEGELSNKYFFNLLNRKSNDDITVILNEANVEIKDPKLIEEEIRNFYKNLYESVPDQLEINDDFFRNLQPLEQRKASLMKEKLTMHELKGTLDSCADSAPGPDGIPYSYLKHFWSDLGPVLLAAWNHSLLVKELPPSHKLSYLKLIPKVGKDARLIANLRPITLSNTDHKLITKTYARKMTTLIAELISEEQTAYIPGRLINDNVRAMLMTVDLANLEDNVDGLLISLDAKKAFDSVDHRFIRKVLVAFGLEDFVPVFNVLYKDLKSNIIVNGKAVNGYSILKGVKQGDALSCILFIMCMEPLLRNLKENNDIERLSSRSMNIELPKSYGYADDVNVLLKRTQQGVQGIFMEYETFTKASGLILNADKTEVLRFNSRHETDCEIDFWYMGTNHKVRAKDRIKVNGIWLFQDKNRRVDFNVTTTIEAMERLLDSWSKRRLTLLGRILVIKTFAVSKAIYLMQSMTLNDAHQARITKLLFKYLWNKNFNANRAPERIKRSVMLAPVSNGGFGMINIKELMNSLDLRSYGRLLTSSHPLLSQLRHQINSRNFFNLKVIEGVDDKLTKSLALLNLDRQSILKWPKEIIIKDANLRSIIAGHKVCDLLTEIGKRSLPYFAIHGRLRGATFSQLTAREYASIERFIIYPELRPIIRTLLEVRQQPILINGLTSLEAYPDKGSSLKRISTLSSKQLRISRSPNEETMQCIYKLGLIMTPGELKAWTIRIKKLTSTRHKNILLRAAHGDIFSNSRLFKFGLKDDPKCSNCDEPIETVIHRLVECPKALAAWTLLEENKRKLGLTTLSDLTIENLMGTKDRIGKIELALQAELILKLTSRSESYCPEQLVKAATMLVCESESLNAVLKQEYKRFKRGER